VKCGVSLLKHPFELNFFSPKEQSSVLKKTQKLFHFIFFFLNQLILTIMFLFSYSVFVSVFILRIQLWRTYNDECVDSEYTTTLSFFFLFFLKSIDSHNHAFVFILFFCFYFCFTDPVVKNIQRWKRRRWAHTTTLLLVFFFFSKQLILTIMLLFLYSISVSVFVLQIQWWRTTTASW